MRRNETVNLQGTGYYLSKGVQTQKIEAEIHINIPINTEVVIQPVFLENLLNVWKQFLFIFIGIYVLIRKIVLFTFEYKIFDTKVLNDLFIT